MRRVALVVCGFLLAAGCATSAGDAPNAAAPDAASPSAEATSPSPADRFRFLALGDFGSGSVDQYSIANRMCKLRAQRGFDHVITTGDNVYPVGHSDRFDAAFFVPYGCLLKAGVKFHATLGNHDVRTDNGRPELDEPAFGMEGRNYVWRAGGVRFVMANSNNFNLDWLRGALTAEPGDRWTVVAFHHPVYSSGHYGPTPGLRPRLPRMFRAKGVDLVLNGHEHHYEVSKPLGGIRYVVTGGGGASVRPCGEPRWFRSVCRSRFHFLEIVAGRDEIVVKALPPAGRFFHRFRTIGRE